MLINRINIGAFIELLHYFDKYSEEVVTRTGRTNKNTNKKGIDFLSPTPFLFVQIP